MAYIGNSPIAIAKGKKAVYTFTATAGQTAFSGVDSAGTLLDLVSVAIDNDVYLNGARLLLTDDYTISNDILTLTAGAAVSDILQIVTQPELLTAGNYSKTEQDARYLNYNGDVISGNMTVAGDLNFGDNNKAIFGAGNDLNVFHNGSHSYVQDSGTGNLYLAGSNVIISNPTSSETMAYFDDDGAVSLWYNNAIKIATTATGIDVTGNLVVSGTVDGIDIATRDAILTTAAASAAGALLRAGGTMTGAIAMNASNITLGDQGFSSPNYSNSIEFGAAADLRIGHHATAGNQIVGSGTYGNIVIQSHKTEIKDNGATLMADFSAEGHSGARLYWQGNVKFETTATGVAATGLFAKAIAKDISNTAADVFVYDTSKDSDGGAWRKRTQNTSWYNETLSSTKRGSRKEFPAVAVIVLENTKLTIYDGDDPDMPMWMVFDCNAQDMIGGINSSGGSWLSGVTMINGELHISSVSGYAPYYFSVKFISDDGIMINHTNQYIMNGSISQRNDGLSGYIGVSGGLVHLYCRDVAVTVLPNAPINYATGLPVPTVAIATANGVSVIRDNGVIVDIGYANYDDVYNIYFNKKHHLIFSQYNGATQSAAKVYYDIPFADIANAQGGYQRGAETVAYGKASISFDINLGGDPIDISDISEDSFGTSVKLVLTDETTPPTSTMLNFITSDYQTGWIVGNNKLATLSDTDTTNVTGPELVTNGTFASNVNSWVGTSGGSLSLVSNTMEVTGVGYGSQGITTVVGKVYVVSYDYIRVGGINGKLYIGTANNNGSIVSTGALSSSGSYATTFTAVGTTTFLNFRTDSSGDTRWDNISCHIAEEDRSVNGKGVQVFGTVIKTAVATGAELVAYSGFSADANRLQQAYNADYQFGTGDFSFHIWAKVTGTAVKYLFSRYGVSGGGGFGAYLNSAGKVAIFISQAPSTNNEFASTHAINDGQWHLVSYVRSPSRAYMYIDGNLSNSAAVASGFNVNVANNYPLVIGNYSNLGYGWLGSLALLRISATATSGEQVAKMYNDEKHLFQTNAKATLYGSSNAVTAVAHDDSTNLLHAGTSAGRSVFQGLVRIDNTTDAVGVAISASNGMVAED